MKRLERIKTRLTIARQAHPLGQLLSLCGELEWAVGEIDRLQAIVDTLPKCWRLDESGNRVRDVPVTPNMQLWRHCEKCNVAHEFDVLSVFGSAYLTKGSAPVCSMLPPIAECSDTREAAEAASDA